MVPVRFRDLPKVTQLETVDPGLGLSGLFYMTPLVISGPPSSGAPTSTSGLSTPKPSITIMIYGPPLPGSPGDTINLFLPVEACLDALTSTAPPLLPAQTIDRSPLISGAAE